MLGVARRNVSPENEIADICKDDPLFQVLHGGRVPQWLGHLSEHGARALSETQKPYLGALEAMQNVLDRNVHAHDKNAVRHPTHACSQFDPKHNKVKRRDEKKPLTPSSLPLPVLKRIGRRRGVGG